MTTRRLLIGLLTRIASCLLVLNQMAQAEQAIWITDAVDSARSQEDDQTGDNEQEIGDEDAEQDEGQADWHDIDGLPGPDAPGENLNRVTY